MADNKQSKTYGLNKIIKIPPTTHRQMLPFRERSPNVARKNNAKPINKKGSFNNVEDQNAKLGKTTKAYQKTLLLIQMRR